MSLPKSSLLVLFGAIFLVSCLGTDAKRIGSKTTPAIPSPDTDVDSFSVTFAYRKDLNPANGRVVVLQGVRNIASAALANSCGTTGATCQCLFYRSTSDTSPASGLVANNGLSTTSNSISCTIPASVVDADVDLYTKVRLKTTSGSKSTGFISVSTSITLADVIGDLAVNKVRGIYRYACTRTFFEGEGVSASQIDCPVSQRLGLITAAYNYYLHNSQLGGNLDKKGSNVAWESAICGRQFPKLTCDGVPEVRWGLYAEQTGIFQVPITLVANGVDADARQVYGYAALTDTKGNCPLGLVKVSQWDAQPGSITQGSITQGPPPNPPSSFLNQSNNLNNRQVEESQPSAYVVMRQSNPNTAASRCSAVDGSCASATFNPATLQQSIAYTQLTPIVCVIPREMVIGLF